MAATLIDVESSGTGVLQKQKIHLDGVLVPNDGIVEIVLQNDNPARIINVKMPAYGKCNQGELHPIDFNLAAASRHDFNLLGVRQFNNAAHQVFIQCFDEDGVTPLDDDGSGNAVGVFVTARKMGKTPTQ